GSGLYDMRSRWYDPSQAHFLTIDPLQSPGENLYGYAGNSPIALIDPTGLKPTPGSGLGAAAHSVATTRTDVLEESGKPTGHGFEPAFESYNNARQHSFPDAVRDFMKSLTPVATPPANGLPLVNPVVTIYDTGGGSGLAPRRRRF